MLDAIRTAMARSHAGAAAILFLLGYASIYALNVVLVPVWGLLQLLSAALGDPRWLWQWHASNDSSQQRVLALVLQLARVAFFYFAARLLSRWIYRCGPIQILSAYGFKPKEETHD